MIPHSGKFSRKLELLQFLFSHKRRVFELCENLHHSKISSYMYTIITKHCLHECVCGGGGGGGDDILRGGSAPLEYTLELCEDALVSTSKKNSQFLYRAHNGAFTQCTFIITLHVHVHVCTCV